MRGEGNYWGGTKGQCQSSGGNVCGRSAMAEHSHASFIRKPLMWVGCGGVYVKYRPSLEGCRMWKDNKLQVWDDCNWHVNLLLDVGEPCRTWINSAQRKELHYSKMTTYNRNWKTHLKFDSVKHPAVRDFQFLCFFQVCWIFMPTFTWKNINWAKERSFIPFSESLHSSFSSSVIEE